MRDQGKIDKLEQWLKYNTLPRVEDEFHRWACDLQDYVFDQLHDTFSGWGSTIRVMDPKPRTTWTWNRWKSAFEFTLGVDVALQGEIGPVAATITGTFYCYPQHRGGIHSAIVALAAGIAAWLHGIAQLRGNLASPPRLTRGASQDGHD